MEFEMKLEFTNTVKKYIALTLCILCIGTSLYGTIMQENLYNRGFYTYSEEEYLRNEIYEKLEDDAAEIFEIYKNYGSDIKMHDSNMKFILVDYNNQILMDNTDNYIGPYSYLWEYYIYIEDLVYEVFTKSDVDIAEKSNEYILQAYIDEEFLYSDKYMDIYLDVERGYNLVCNHLFLSIFIFRQT